MPKAKAPATSALINAKAMMMRWARLCLNSIAALGEAIADAMDGMQQRFFKRFVDHLAQLMHMAAQAVAVGQSSPHRASSSTSRRSTCGLFCISTASSLRPTGLSLSRRPGGYFEGVEVVAQVGHLQGTAPAALGTAQHRFDARRQLRQGKWLEQVVIGTGAEALQAVVQLVTGGEHDHRRVAAGVFAQALAQGVAIDAGQHDVEHDQVVVFGGGQVQPDRPSWAQSTV
jgi:hypothetical protein